MDPLRAIRGDVEALAAMERRSASPGERRSAEWLAGRLRDAGAADVRLQTFRYQHEYSSAHGLHCAAGIGAAALSSAPLALAAAASFHLEFGGRSQWVRRFLPAGEGTNVLARIPATGGARRTLVLVAHHDAAHTGLVWHPGIAGLATRRAAQTGKVDSFANATFGAFGLVAAGSLLGRRGRSLRRAGGLFLALQCALLADVARGETVPGASDNATGVAAVLELVRRYAREPFEDVEILVVIPGCEESGMGGMAAWLRSEGSRLDPARTFVLGLDTLGSGEPVVLSGEGPTLTERYRDEDVAWVERAAHVAGIERPRRFRIGGWTDPILAVFAGVPAVSILSVNGAGAFSNYHLPSDTPENVDWGSVDRCLRLAAGTAEAWAVGSGR